MTVSTQLRKTQTTVLDQGAHFLGQTRTAGTRLVSTTIEAGEQFVAEARDATLGFAEDTRAAGSAFASSLAGEARAWRSVVDHEIANPLRLRAQTAQTRANELALKARPQSVEELILRSVQDVLKRAGLLVDTRLKGLSGQKQTTSKRSARAKKPVAKAADKTPLRNYDRLSARDVVARIHRLSGPQAKAVLSYEKAKKRRATVIRAAQQRVAAAS